MKFSTSLEGLLEIYLFSIPENKRHHWVRIAWRVIIKNPSHRYKNILRPGLDVLLSKIKQLCLLIIFLLSSKNFRSLTCSPV